MPLIKDKYQAKGVSPRSKFVTRKFNQAIQSDTGWELNCERLGIDTGEKKKSKGINIELPS